LVPLCTLDPDDREMGFRGKGMNSRQKFPGNEGDRRRRSV